MAKGAVFTEEATIPPSVSAFLGVLVETSSIQRLVLFGSRAVGDHEQTADIDLAVFASSLSRSEFAGLRVAAYEARSLYQISLIHFEQTPESLQNRILEQGICLYDRT